MLNEKIKTLRKNKGLTQEEMAVRLGVVRQTVSKWEKGLSVPDAEMLIRIADLFETSVSELLDGETGPEKEQDDISEQLSRINEQLAVRNRRSRFVLRLLLGILIVWVLFWVIVLVGVAALRVDVHHQETMVPTEITVKDNCFGDECN